MGAGLNFGRLLLASPLQSLRTIPISYTEEPRLRSKGGGSLIRPLSESVLAPPPPSEPGLLWGKRRRTEGF